MRPSTRSPPVPCCPHATSTTSATLGTDTRPFSIAPPTRLLGVNCLGSRSSRRRRRTSASDLRRTTTGSTGTRQRRTAWAAGAAAIPISSTWRARRAVVWPNGSTSPADGPALRRGESACQLGPRQPVLRDAREEGLCIQINQHRAWLAWSRRERTRDRSCHDFTAGNDRGKRAGGLGSRAWETCASRFMSDFCLYSVTKEPQSSEHYAWEVSTASLLGRMPHDKRGAREITVSHTCILFCIESKAWGGGGGRKVDGGWSPGASRNRRAQRWPASSGPGRVGQHGSWVSRTYTHTVIRYGPPVRLSILLVCVCVRLLCLPLPFCQIYNDTTYLMETEWVSIG